MSRGAATYAAAAATAAGQRRRESKVPDEHQHEAIHIGVESLCVALRHHLLPALMAWKQWRCPTLAQPCSFSSEVNFSKHKKQTASSFLKHDRTPNKLIAHHPPPVATDGEAANPGPFPPLMTQTLTAFDEEESADWEDKDDLGH